MTDYSISWEDVLMTARKERENFEVYSSAEQSMVIEEVEARVSENNFGTMTKVARRLLGAHIAAMMDQVSAGRGTDSSESVGSVSGTATMLVNNPTAEQNLLSTVYGRQFYEIRKSKFRPFYVG
jgi:hypothetical protein